MYTDPSAFHRSDSVHRVAFTLLELLLTLAILAAVAAVVIPRLDGLLASSELDRAAKLLMVEMTRARVDAMREGQVRMLEVSPETSDFRIRPFSSLADATETNDISVGTSALLTGADQAVFVPLEPETGVTKQRQLPTSVLFGEVSVAATARSNHIAQSATEMSVPTDDVPMETTTPVMFYPDGTTSDAAIEVKHPEMGARLVKLRGITGDVTIVETILNSDGG